MVVPTLLELERDNAKEILSIRLRMLDRELVLLPSGAASAQSVDLARLDVDAAKQALFECERAIIRGTK